MKALNINKNIEYKLTNKELELNFATYWRAGILNISFITSTVSS